MGQSSPTDAQTARDTLIARSVRSLRGAVKSFGGAAVLSSLAAVETAAKELSRSERRRLRRQRERQEDREGRQEDREERRKRKEDDEDDDDDGDRISILRAKHAALMDRANDGGRRVSAKQAAEDDPDEDADAETAAERRSRRQAAEDDDSAEADGDDEPVVTEAEQVAEETDPESDTTVLRVGSGDTWASIDFETGTATAESNGVRAIAGPDGATIEGSSSGPSSSPATPAGGDLDADGNDDGDLLDPAGGDNGEEELLS